MATRGAGAAAVDAGDRAPQRRIGIGGDRNRVRKTINEQSKAERPHRGGPQPIETVVGRWELGAFAATTEAARVSVPSADP
jgi:hypothetical protein